MSRKIVIVKDKIKDKQKAEGIFENIEEAEAWVKNCEDRGEFGDPDDHEVLISDYVISKKENADREISKINPALILEALVQYHEGDDGLLKSIMKKRKDVRDRQVGE